MSLMFITITNECNKSCPYCPMAEWRNNGVAMDLDWLRRTISGKYSGWDLEITGGEPSIVPGVNEFLASLPNQRIVVKTNGTNPLVGKPNILRVAAWHDEFPVCEFDWLLIIRDKPRWKEKAGFARENRIPFKIIGSENCSEQRLFYSGITISWISADGLIRKCYCKKTPGETQCCPICKSVHDHYLFQRRA